MIRVRSGIRAAAMTLTQFVVKQSFRNKRRTAMTIISIGVSLLLLTLMMTVWRAFYIDQGAPNSSAPDVTSSSFAGVLPSRLLSKQDSQRSGRGECSADVVVRRAIQRR